MNIKNIISQEKDTSKSKYVHILEFYKKIVK